MSQVKDIRDKIEQQMDSVLEGDENGKASETELDQQEEDEQKNDYMNESNSPVNNVEPTTQAQNKEDAAESSKSRFGFEFESFLGRSTEIITKAVNSWNDYDEDGLSIDSDTDDIEREAPDLIEAGLKAEISQYTKRTE